MLRNLGAEAERLRKLELERLIAERDAKVRQLQAERARIIQMHDDRDRHLQEQIRLLDRDEEERRRNRKPVQQQQPVAGNLDFEHFVDGSQSFTQLGEDEIARLCDDLFRNAPIVFSASKNKEN